MKKLLPIVFILLLCFPFGIAWGGTLKSFPVKGPEGDVRVLHLAENGSSVLLLCRYSPNPEMSAFPIALNISGKTKIVTPDGDYSLLKAFHLPVKDEAEPHFAYVKAKCPELNFVLEFEKFPFDEPFDLVEGSDEASSIILRGITVDTGSAGTVNEQEFLSLTPYSEYSYVYKDGSPVYRFDDGGIYLASTCYPYNNDDDYYLDVGFEIVNRTKAPFTLKLSDISASALKYNKRQQRVKCNLVLMDAKKADKEWKSLDEAEIINEVPANAGDYAAGAAARAAMAPGMSALGTLGFLALGAVVTAASSADLEPYMKERNEERERLMKLYLRESTVEPGDTLRTFASIKYKGTNIASTVVSININGETYTLQY